MKINQEYINDYKKIIQTTNLQKGYQELIKYFRYMRTFLEKAIGDFQFTGNIVENNMDYSYFQFTNEEFKSKGLKFVIAFVHHDFNFEIWLSGTNRKIQKDYYEIYKNQLQRHTLTSNPNKTDYIIKSVLSAECNFDDPEQLLIDMKVRIDEFICNMREILV